MIKRFVLLLLCVVMLTWVFAGCTSKPAETGQTTETKEAAESDTSSDEKAAEETKPLEAAKLTYYYWNEAQKEAQDAIYAEFKKAFPQIEVETTVVPWANYWTKLQTSLPSGAGPDVYQLNAPHAVEYLPAGLAMPLQDKIDAEGLDMSVYPEAIKNLYTYEGKLYAMPKDYDSIALFYNKAMFDEANVKYPDDTWTWTEFLDAAKKLTKPDGSQYGFAADSYAQTGLGNFIFQNGGEFFAADGMKSAINSPENIETVQFISDLMNKYKVSPSYSELVETPSYTLFMGEKVAMITFGSWYVGPIYEALGDKLGIAPLPMKKTRACVLHGLGYAIDAKTKYPEQAWAFVKFLASKQANEIQSSVVIPAYAGMEGKWLEQFPMLDLKVFIDAAKYGKPFPVALKNSTAVETAMYNALDKVWNGSMSVEDALKEAEANMNAELSK
ncbi:MAG: ABC transporter substrate-binding protein [Bacillota bacterium]